MEGCLWCTESAISPESVTAFLTCYCTGELTAKKVQDAESDFIYCSDCVVEYHQARERVPALHKRLWDLETNRLLNFFWEMLMNLEEYDLYFVENGHEEPVSKFTSVEFLGRLRCPLMEVLKYPYLLCHQDLCGMVVKVLCQIKDMNVSGLIEEQYPGIYLLMVHPNETVRRWAIATAKSMGRVDRDKYYDLQEVFSCMFYILDLGITLDFPSVDGSQYSGKIQFLPPHLYDSKNKKSYWLGICMLLMQLDSQAMDSLLMGKNGQASIPHCIINTMTDCHEGDQESDPFWPALQCFLVILDRLGSTIWGQIEPIEAFRAIIKAKSYMAEIQAIQQKTSGTRVKEEPDNHDDPLSCSQMVYDCYAMARPRRSSGCSSSNQDPSGTAIFEEMSCLVNVLQSKMGQGMRVYGSTFLWFIPFVRSVMELPELNVICTGEVIHYLHNNINKDVLYRQKLTCDKVTEFFIRILVDIIELHLLKGHMGTLSYFSHIWVDIVIQCATLSNEVGVGAVSKTCRQLICSLLKEGGRTGAVPESTRFLNPILKHQRTVPAKAWTFPQSEYEGLMKCIFKLIKTISDRPAVSNVAPPTPPSDPYPNALPLQQLQTRDAEAGPSSSIYKEEPPWNDGEYQGNFCDGRQEIIKSKNEPENSVPISEFKDFLEVACIKPDFGKIHEIRSKLKDDQNLSRILAIAKGRFETEDEQSKCSLSKEIANPKPSASHSGILASARHGKSSKTKFNDDDEPLDVRRRRLKRSHKSCDEDLTDARRASCAAKEQQDDIITISDDEALNGTKPLENGSTHDFILDLECIESPGRDYDDLSESQVFEFETQEDMASAWNDLHIDVTKKHELKNDEAYNRHDAVEPMDTQPVTDDAIEKVCLQLEAQVCPKQPPLVPSVSSMQVPPEQNFNEKCDFIQSKHSENPPGKSGLIVEGKKWLNKNPPVIEALCQKVKRHRRPHNAASQEPLKPCSTSSVVSPAAIATSRDRSASAVAPSPSTPAIVPPKKIRKPIEPKSAAELLGLKKKERKAFDLSQRTLDCLDELRSHGQNVNVEPQQKSKGVRQQKSKRARQQKFGVKKGKKLLASQDMQYFRQSRRMPQQSMPATAAVPKLKKCFVPDTLPKPKPATETMEEQREEEDDYFLPCSQPDPDRRRNGELGTGEVNSLSNDSKETSESKDFSFLQTNKGAEGSMAKGAESRDENCDDEWIYLTQNEPTDMELCSQMDQLEEEYGKNVINAEGVPMDNDSENQPQGSKEKTSVPLEALSGSSSPKSLPHAFSAATLNDHVFLKPSIPAECQKKVKPPTTKIYSSSSRNASLAKEMGKVGNPPPAANIAKAKVARPSPVMPPPPPKSTPQQEFRQPLPPRPALKSPNRVTPASHVPSYKTYPRPETPVFVKTPTVAKNQRRNNSPKFDPSYLTQEILKWKYSMFENYKSFGTPENVSLETIPTSFRDYDEYFDIIYPHLHINVFEEMARKWLNKEIEIELILQGFDYINHTARAHFTASLNNDQQRLHPKEEDLVLLWLPENTDAYSTDDLGFPPKSAYFGCVSKSNVINTAGQLPTLYLTIQTRGNVSSVSNQLVRCELIGSLVTALREFKALCSLRNNSIMACPVLKPHVKFFASCQDALPTIDMPKFNKDQTQAISCGVAMVKREEETAKILLIHGAPGTGKSKVIVGILDSLLSNGQSSSVNRCARITRVLLCAPSNAAIDNLMKKIINTFKANCLNIQAPQGTCGDINLVRLGNEGAISKFLKGFSLNSQVQKRLEKVQQRSDLDIQRRMKELDKLIEKLSQQCAKTDKRSSLFQQQNAEKLCYSREREELGRSLKEFRSKRQQVQSRILLDANVICCTLSTSGSVLLENAFRHLGHKPFTCVIVDEAGQAKETETLIPLLYRCKDLILVGDPMQLPPTVVCQKAKDRGYDQSLMARLYNNLVSSNKHLLSSIFLSLQYRMHPDICEFPSKYIYGNKLKSDGETAQKLCSSSWPFEPYRVFDVTDGQESKERDSFSNWKEVKLVMLLLKLFGEKQAMSKEKQAMCVGVITPYKAQKECIKETVKKELDEEIKTFIKLEVDTVDGFQGREMDCIIVSCVRASNKYGSIGFLGNRQRMNVMITRSKFSLFILGHLSTLKEHEDWGELIKDAEKRGTIIRAPESEFERVTKKVLKRPVSRSHSYPPNHVSSSAHSEHRMHTRPTDPRLPDAHHASRDQDRENQSYTLPRPPNLCALDPRRHQGSARSFHSTSERSHERRSPFSVAPTRPHRK